MFTGLIAGVGRIGRISRRPQGLEYEVCCSLPAGRLVKGASVAVNGVCQTVREGSPRGFITEAVSSTLEKTTIGRLKTGDPVNLEPALLSGDPLDGHIMQGHVQRTGRLLSVKKAGLAHVLEIGVDDPASIGIVSEGSAGIDGISLTVSSIGRDVFTVHIIPETWESTTLRLTRRGDLLNIEGDILLRGGERGRSGTEPAGLTEKNLIEWGY